MNSEIIERVEEIVEKISNCYQSIPEEIVKELNDISGNDWKESEYIEYCAEYWSRSTLEETVYAILNDGEYPENVDSTVCFWKNNELIDMDEDQIMYSLMSVPSEIESRFEDISMDDIVSWFQKNFGDYDISEKKNEEGVIEYDFEYKGEIEYSKYKYFLLEIYGKKMVIIRGTNISVEERALIERFMEKIGLVEYVYE